MKNNLYVEVTPEELPEDKKKLVSLREKVAHHEYSLMVLATIVRLVILVWSGAILTLAYVKLPPEVGIPEQDLDPTFIASVFTGVLATFGIQAADKNGNKITLTYEQLDMLLDRAEGSRFHDSKTDEE